MEKHKQEEPLSLMDALGFDAGDLLANAEGRLSERQRQQFKYEYGRIMRWGLIGGVVTAGVIVVLMSIFAYNVCAAGVIGCALMVFVVALFYRSLMTDWAKLNDVLRLPVQSAEGVITLDIEGGASSTVPRYVMKLGDVRFEVSKSIFLAFKNGDPYRLYFVPNAMLLSAESLRLE